MGSKENESPWRLNNLFWGYKMFYWFKALNFLRSDRCCPRILQNLYLSTHIYMNYKVIFYSKVFERVNVWLESIPDDWKENKSKNNIQIKSENYGNCDYYDEDFFAVDELATEPGDDFVSLENIKV